MTLTIDVWYDQQKVQMTHIAYKGAYSNCWDSFVPYEAYFYAYKCHKQCQIGKFTVKNGYFDLDDPDLWPLI